MVTRHARSGRSLRVRTIALLAAIGLGSLAASGCAKDEKGPDPAIGDWVSAEQLEGYENTLEIDADLSGEATIYFYYEGTLYYNDFDVEGTVVSRGARYEFDMECQGDCADFDFEMDCEMGPEDEMECEGDGLWADYEFEWELD